MHISGCGYSFSFRHEYAHGCLAHGHIPKVIQPEDLLDRVESFFKILWRTPSIVYYILSKHAHICTDLSLVDSSRRSDAWWASMTESRSSALTGQSVISTCWKLPVLPCRFTGGILPRCMFGLVKGIIPLLIFGISPAAFARSQSAFCTATPSTASAMSRKASTTDAQASSTTKDGIMLGQSAWLQKQITVKAPSRGQYFGCGGVQCCVCPQATGNLRVRPHRGAR